MNEEEYFEQLCSNSVDGTLTDSEREKLETHLAEQAAAASSRLVLPCPFSPQIRLTAGSSAKLSSS